MPGAMDDLRKLCASETHAGRLAALKTMLFARNVPYVVEKVRPRTAFVIPQPPDGRNVLVTVGKGPRDIVISAHYDAVTLGDGSLSRGAVDNGAAVVTLVRVAQTLRTMKLNSRVRILFTDKEEAGGLGARRFASAHQKEPIMAAIVLDVVSSGSAVYFCPSGPSPEPAVRQPLKWGSDERLGKMVEDVCGEQNLAHIRSKALGYTDQRSFWDYGLPSVWIAVLPEAKAHQLWLADNAKSAGLAPGLGDLSIIGAHSEADTPDAVTPEAMATAYNVVLSLVRKLDAEHQ